jgi:predicted O-methyltransferase YrrM
MMSNHNDALVNYALNYSTPEDNLLAELNRETHLKVLHPRMLSGQLQGKLLEFLSRMIRPAYILEIGTFTGYSAICLAKGLSEGGKLISIEKNDEIISFSRRFIDKSGLKNKIEIKVGNALKIIPDLDYLFDLVFIDGDKKDYINYYNLIIDKVSPGGYILADNILWGGKVLEEVRPADKDTSVIKLFNELILSDPRVENLILPIRDGLSLIRKVL